MRPALLFCHISRSQKGLQGHLLAQLADGCGACRCFGDIVTEDGIWDEKAKNKITQVGRPVLCIPADSIGAPSSSARVAKQTASHALQTCRSGK